MVQLFCGTPKPSKTLGFPAGLAMGESPSEIDLTANENFKIPNSKKPFEEKMTGETAKQLSGRKGRLLYDGFYEH